MSGGQVCCNAASAGLCWEPGGAAQLLGLSAEREEGDEERQLCRLVGFLLALLFLTALKAT